MRFLPVADLFYDKDMYHISITTKLDSWTGGKCRLGDVHNWEAVKFSVLSMLHVHKLGACAYCKFNAAKSFV